MVVKLIYVHIIAIMDFGHITAGVSGPTYFVVLSLAATFVEQMS
jgi:hypothetical protein